MQLKTAHTRNKINNTYQQVKYNLHMSITTETSPPESYLKTICGLKGAINS